MIHAPGSTRRCFCPSVVVSFSASWFHYLYCSIAALDTHLWQWYSRTDAIRSEKHVLTNAILTRVRFHISRYDEIFYGHPIGTRIKFRWTWRINGVLSLEIRKGLIPELFSVRSSRFYTCICNIYSLFNLYPSIIFNFN